MDFRHSRDLIGTVCGEHPLVHALSGGKELNDDVLRRRQFDPSELWFGDAGAGIEFRFTPQVGVFADGRYVFTESSPNYGLFRAGVRFAF